MENGIIRALLEHGAIGLVAAIAIGAAWHKDRQVTKVYETLVTKLETIAASHRQVASELEGVIRRLEQRLTAGKGK